MGSDQAIPLSRYDRLQHALNFSQRLYPVLGLLLPQDRLSGTLPLFTLTR
jgi:hypothetical protein